MRNTSHFITPEDTNGRRILDWRKEHGETMTEKLSCYFREKFDPAAPTVLLKL